MGAVVILGVDDAPMMQRKMNYVYKNGALSIEMWFMKSMEQWPNGAVAQCGNDWGIR